MVSQTKLNTALISFTCAFGIAVGVVVLLGLVGTRIESLAPIFAIGAVVLSYFFYGVGDIKLILAYSLVAMGFLLLLFPMFMYLGIPNSFPEIRITGTQALLIGLSTGLAALVLAIAILKSPFKGK
jgi:hypothetical protein